MSLLPESIPTSYETVQETEVTSQATLLSLLSGGHPYVFIVPRITGENDETLRLELATNIPGSDSHILRTVIEAVLRSLPDEENDSQE